jgi:hypothetical protein
MTSAPHGPDDDAGAAPQSDVPGHTPDPAEDGPDPIGNPVDPAIATSTPDPGQTGRDRR